MKDADPQGATAPLPEEPPRPKRAELPPAEDPRDARPLDVGWRSDRGRVRDLNEDSLCAIATQFCQGDDQQSLGLLVVADGMGGHEHGERASALAVRVVCEEVLRRLISPLIAPAGDVTPSPLGETMRGAVSKAHVRLKRELPGAGTTLTAALIIDDSVAIAHVGDSRAYLCHQGEIRQLTRDHSLGARLVETGQIAEADEDPRRNMLYRALGQIDALEVDFQFLEFPPGSRILLCSDGLWSVVEPGSLRRILREAKDPSAACRELVDLANDAGGPDNITAVCAIHAVPSAPSRAPGLRVGTEDTLPPAGSFPAR